MSMLPHDCAGSADLEGSFPCINVQERKMQQIDAAIQKRVDEILALKSQRNECTPISRLPVEIMTNIFLVVKKMIDDAMDVRSTYTRRRRLQWIQVSHVSTTWRNIALNFAGLWIEPPFWNIPWAEEMLRRSKGAALAIKFDFSVDSSPKPRKLLQEALHGGENITELHLAAVTDAHLEIIPTSLLRLTKLHVNGFCLQSPIPAVIFSEANKLRELSLSSCKIDWMSYLPHSIRTLRLQDVHTPSPSAVARFLDALEHLSLLEVLELKYSMGSFEIPNHPLRPIKLPMLRNLTILSQMTHAAMFFRHVTVPSNMLSLAVQTREMVDRSPNFVLNTKDMLAAIGRIYSDQSCNLSFRVLSLGRNGVSLNFFFDDASFLLSSASLSLSIAPVGAVMTSNSVDILNMIFSSGLPMNNINTVHIESSIPFSAETLAQTLGRLVNVSRVRTYSLLSQRLLEAIQLPSAVEELHFSKLSVLELEGLECDPEHSGDNALFNKLRDCLMCRCEYGAEITRLVLEDCYQLDENMVELLEEIVVEVDWDSVEQGFTEDEESQYGTGEDYDYMYYDYDDSDDYYDYYGGMFF